MPYSRTQIAAFRTFRQEVTEECSEVVHRYAARQYANDQAKEYATHAFGRRLYILLRCVDRVFSIIPPGSKRRPKGERVDDVIINLQAFVFNASGCLDNLAWIWVLEKDVPGDDGAKLAPSRVGLGRRYKEVWRSLPREFKDYLHTLKAWRTNLEDYRHALAHRVPLYVPPFIITPADEAEFQELQRMAELAAEAGDYPAFFEARTKLQTVGSFEPMMVHSFGEGSRPIHYHGQVLNDLKAIAHIANRLLAELEKPPS
jgi:hypothetical protein